MAARETPEKRRRKRGREKRGIRGRIFVYVYGEKVKMEYSRVWRFALTACRRIVLVPGKYLKHRKKNVRLDCWANFWTSNNKRVKKNCYV